MENTLSKTWGFTELERLNKEHYTAHSDQTATALQDLVPFLKEVEAKINSIGREIEHLQNRVEQLDRLQSP